MIWIFQLNRQQQNVGGFVLYIYLLYQSNLIIYETVIFINGVIACVSSVQ